MEIIVALIACVIILTIGLDNTNSKIDRTNKRLVATMNCYENTAYPRAALSRCIDDYYESRGWLG